MQLAGVKQLKRGSVLELQLILVMEHDRFQYCSDPRKIGSNVLIFSDATGQIKKHNINLTGPFLEFSMDPKTWKFFYAVAMPSTPLAQNSSARYFDFPKIKWTSGLPFLINFSWLP